MLGLGNPGDRYRDTRHNLGFLLVERMAQRQGARFENGPGPSRICSFTVAGLRGILAQPLTWMNRSGVAARSLLAQAGGPEVSRLLAVTDDLDLPLGRIRFRRGGGPGGHNGLRSMIEELGTRDFPRLRIGIGRPESDGREDVVDWVLEPFRPEEWPVVEECLARAEDGVATFLEDGIEAAQNRFNTG
ncbi:MAG: aminoacyl-tRNA hydrolase [bacterium]